MKIKKPPDKNSFFTTKEKTKDFFTVKTSLKSILINYDKQGGNSPPFCYALF